ncbi:WhiB family transcriptional regulator [Streptomyces reniochalinae]|uniref:WhiB family transcriptional regulator n=1 Tax=Streptomyces reniochalinae TaxID=2250578 RepID=UPI001C689F0F|nr:WhiB family transcriptional regulator [Streptomyces reniochalinae]
MNTSDWKAKAICADEPDFWYPVGNSGPAKADADLAKWICNARCYVRAQCREDVLQTEAGWPMDRRHGIAGGLSPSERLALDPTRTTAA